MTPPAPAPALRPRASLRYLLRAWDALEGAGLRGELSPRSFSTLGSASASTTVALNFAEVSFPGFGVLRFTGIDSARIEIFSLLAFPDDPEAHPVFASEYVFMGSVVRAAVVDFQLGARCPAARAALARLASRHARLLHDGEYPEWCRPHFTRSAVFQLRETALERRVLEHAFDDYLGEFAGLVARTGAPAPVEDAAELADYKAHHCRHTPGRPFLSRCFGADWTEDFLAGAMYAPQPGAGVLAATG
ncbi:MAG: hypothetical protein SF028_05990 [Candidatus Sumerlaeia bacterium]|nr:hypothetical protein [Candidatus Sumerlaeia bacterium]